MPSPHFDSLLSDMIMHSHDDGDVSDLGTNFLKLDQTTPQDISNGAPTFNNGLIIKAGEKLIFDGD